MSDVTLFRYVHSPDLVLEFQALHLSLLVSTYQAGKLVAIRADKGQISTLLRSFEQPMGLAVSGPRLAVGTRSQVWVYRNAPDIGWQIEPQGRHDACFLPRLAYVTGDIRGHEIAWVGDELWIVNTRFSCLATLHPDFNFVPRWQPPFVTALAAEDRCHLNGLAVVDGKPKYASALGETDTAGGWRENKATGGCLIDIEQNTVIARGLCMPHSPRWHQGRLWVLDSGTGRLVTVDLADGRTQTVASLPGYTRGLTFEGRYAFIGLSKVRETSTFGGLPISERKGELKCGVWVVDIQTGQTVAFLEFEKGVEELFDVQILPGIRFPAIVGFQKETVNDTFVVPPKAVR
jgi:uncharacterized protein (TIGR03032 family)